MPATAPAATPAGRTEGDEESEEEESEQGGHQQSGGLLAHRKDVAGDGPHVGASPHHDGADDEGQDLGPACLGPRIGGEPAEPVQEVAVDDGGDGVDPRVDAGHGGGQHGRPPPVLRSRAATDER